MPLGHVGDHHLGHRGFARTAYGDIADADDRNIELLLFQNPPIEKPVAQQDPQLIKERNRHQKKIRHSQYWFIAIKDSNNSMNYKRNTPKLG